MGGFDVREDLKGKYAVIDIGSNTILMAIVECADGQMEIIEDIISIARLGEGVAVTKEISEKALNRALPILENYRDKIDFHKDVSVAAVATSAIRESRNKLDILDRMQHCLGYKINVLSDTEEAELSYFGTFGRSGKGTLIDIGGGSTEFSIYGFHGNRNISIPMGAVKIKEKFLFHDPPTPDEISDARSYIIRQFEKSSLDRLVTNINAVAGTPVTIASIDLGLPGYDFGEIHGHTISAERLFEIINMINCMKTEDLMAKLHVHPHRSDIICAGSLILDSYVEYTGSQQVTVNCLGLRFGLLALPEDHPLIFKYTFQHSNQMERL